MRTQRIMRVGMVAAMAAVMAFSLGMPAFASTGQDGPTPPELGDPVTGPVPEVQVVSVYLTSGTYTLRLTETSNGPLAACYTTAIAWNAAGPKPSSGATGASLEEKLEACVLGGGNVVTTVDVKVERMQSLQPASHYVYKVTFVNPDGPLTEMEPFPDGVAVTVETRQNGVDPATWFTPDGLFGAGTSTVSTTQPPHGGFSSLTDYCLQCHSVHDGNEFALLRDASVTATCQTCHALFGTAATGPFDSNFATGENTRAMGSAAARSAYDLGNGGLISGGSGIIRGHQIGGIGGGAAGDYFLFDGPRTLYSFDSARRNGETTLSADDFTAAEVSGATQDGLYCGSCHTPHGDLGQLANGWKMSDSVAVGTATWTTGNPKITITFNGASSLSSTGFTSAQRKATLRLETNTPSAQDDVYTRVFQQFSTSGTHSSAGYTSVFEVQRVKVDADGGNFTLSFDGQGPTSSLDFNATTAQVRTALEALSNVALGDVVVTGGPGNAGGTTPYVLTWSDTLGNVAQVSASGAGLTGGAATATPSTVTEGALGTWNIGDCPRSPAAVAGGQQSICITDLPTYPGAPVTVYLGDEGRTIGTASNPTRTFRADYDGDGTAPDGWRSCSNVEPTLGTGYNLACTDWATATDAEGQMVSLYGYKLLSSGPNHQMAPTDVKAYATSGAATSAWCGTCHETRFDDGSGLHPTHSAGGGCTACHGNPADGSSFDYPHTSTVSRLLKALPDGLCLTCHSMLP